MDRYLLTICIATYNRAEFLAITLKGIIDQISEFDDVEVLVVDGNSTDNTEAVVTELQSKCRTLRYNKLNEKGGVDKDFDIAVNSSKGQYCWLFTDDDMLKENAIEKVRNVILEGSELIVVNAEICDYELQNVISDNALQLDEDIKTNLLPPEREKFFSLCARYISFIGSIVIQRSCWVETPRNKFYGTRFIHVGVISTLRDNSRVTVITEPQIKIRLGNAEWSGIAFKVWTQLWPDLIWSFSNISDECKKSICLREPWKNVTALLWYRALGSYSTKEYYDLLSTKAMSFHKLASLVIAYLPRLIPRLIFFVHAAIRSDKHRIYVLGDGGKSRNAWRSTS
ncbi:MAG TPA: glycosyltransferase family 2 protein [candidate division Zixibacteria bacterium]|nr:glycosyltransferase family 2 protein [candidate division Zixibacteria bacterium]